MNQDEKQLKAAFLLHQQGKLAEAAEIYERLIKRRPNNYDALHFLGTIKASSGQMAEAKLLIERSLKKIPAELSYVENYATILFQNSDYRKAVEVCSKRIRENGKTDSLQYLRYVLAVSLYKLGAFKHAIVEFDALLQGNPNHVAGNNEKASALAALGRYAEALAHIERALQTDPTYAEAHFNKANVFEILNKRDDAVTSYKTALSLKPDLFAARKRLVSLLLSKGDIAEALDLARRAFAAQKTTETKMLLASCLCSPLLHPGLGDLRDLLTRALTEGWARAGELMASCARFLMFNKSIHDSMAQVQDSWPILPQAAELISDSTLEQIAKDDLFRALLEATPLCGVGLERLATVLRFKLLSAVRQTPNDATDNAVLALYCAVARQCFINNYVFTQSEAEIEQIQWLRDTVAAALASGAAIAPLSLVAIAAYMPLHLVHHAEELLERSWPRTVGEIIQQQVSEPLEEQRLGRSMTTLTAIEDSVSEKVRDQYEQSPYPRWIKPSLIPNPKTIDEDIRDRFPHAPFASLEKSDHIDLLIAGCGTGRHSIETARLFRGVQVLAIDLSRASLCYAERQTRALGITNIQYAQADIMKLPSIGRTFDVVEAVGVLHHLADPFAGWQILLSLLRPGGLMKLGLYSQIARQDIAQARALIAARNYRPTADVIRKFRQELIDYPDGSPLKNVILVSDFFSLNECRDLLFHVQEHQTNLPEVATFIAKNSLRFIGFDLETEKVRNYQRQFPEDTAMTNLAHWHQYEMDNPRTFFNMYQFWVQKISAAGAAGHAD